ncbi:restriction endonuclease subunit S [Chitinophaga sp. CF418]|uniref:restriction endonuclease subunit S n=1 Tax=Chitinophaga sp. CF418 TaxID=1855287 RepID=UPI00122CD585|nr:restriction endonuclease subunit S [Chitinophaga sp. CF418]
MAKTPAAFNNHTDIKFVAFRDLVSWRGRQLLSSDIRSTYPIVRLGDYIREESLRVHLSASPEQEFGILGINNKEGLFDNYSDKGANFNQPYKKVELGWVAYNPYRLNVGSIGLKKELHKNDYISPAYVVFSCKEPLLADFLIRILRTSSIINILNQNTTGTVRASIPFYILKMLYVPLPPIDVQVQLLNTHDRRIAKAEKEEKEATHLFNQSRQFFLNQLGIQEGCKEAISSSHTFIQYKRLSTWASSSITDQTSFNFTHTKFDIQPLKRVITTFEGGKTPATSNSHYWNGDIPWISPKDFKSLYISNSEDSVSETAVSNGLKIHPPGTVLGVFRSSILRHSFPVAMAQIATTINQDVKAMKIKEGIVTNHYFLFYLCYLQNLVLEMASRKGVTVGSIDSDKFLNIPVILPSIPVQKEITRQIVAQHSKINALNESAEAHRSAAEREFMQAIFNTER